MLQKSLAARENLGRWVTKHRRMRMLIEKPPALWPGQGFDSPAPPNQSQWPGHQPKVADGGVVIVPPSWRHDLEIEEDLVEEVARVIGYDHIPAKPPVGPMSMLGQTETQRPLRALRDTLVERGYQEVINLAFTPEAWEQDFAANATPVELANPIASHLSVMRSSLIGGLINTLIHNQRRRQPRLQIFETGRVFERANAPVAGQVDGYRQTLRLGGLSWGAVMPEQWGAKTRSADFFDIKADLEVLCAPHDLYFAPLVHPALHPGRSAQVVFEGKPVGLIGELHPKLQQTLELPFAPVLFEIEAQFLQQKPLPVYSEISKFPAVTRDLALLVKQSLNVQSVLDVFHELRMGNHVCRIMQHIVLFDEYRGKGLLPDEKSLAFRITMQDTQSTLQDESIDAALSVFIDVVNKKLGATLRK